MEIPSATESRLDSALSNSIASALEFHLDNRFCPAFYRNVGWRVRRLAAIYAIGLLVTVAAAPHHHLNSLADLLTDGPSDSGVIVEIQGPPDPASGVRINAVHLIDDEPCPACFHHDFAAVAGHWIQLTETLKRLGESNGPRIPAPPRLIQESPASRSPPGVV